MRALASWFVLWLIFGGSEADDLYLGITVTFYPRDSGADDSHVIEIRYRITASQCLGPAHAFTCSHGDCGETTRPLHSVVGESSTARRPMCQTEVIETLKSHTNAPYNIWITEHEDTWVKGVSGKNLPMKVFSEVDLRQRSDTGRANYPPQATIVSPIRVASNCARKIRPLIFDPDGDKVVCRYGKPPQECDPCDQPPVFSFSPNCELTFKSTDSTGQGLYVVELMMEDYAQEDIVLTQDNGSQEKKSLREHISSVPIQFALEVSPALPLCEEGLFLPRFVEPTPKHGAQIRLPVSQRTQIGSIQFEASKSIIWGLLFSGPAGVEKRSMKNLGFTLSWAPTSKDDKGTYPLCFVAQVLYNWIEYHSEVRCVLLIVGSDVVTTGPPTTPPASTSSNLATSPSNPATTPTTMATTNTPTNATSIATDITSVTPTLPPVTDTTTPKAMPQNTSYVTVNTTDAPTNASLIAAFNLLLTFLLHTVTNTTTLDISPTVPQNTSHVTMATTTNAPTNATSVMTNTTTPPSPITNTTLDIATNLPQTTSAAAHATTPSTVQNTSKSDKSTTGLPDNSPPVAPKSTIVFLRSRISTSVPLSEDDMEAVLTQVRAELERRGIQPNLNFTFRVTSITPVQSGNTTAPPTAPNGN